MTEHYASSVAAVAAFVGLDRGRIYTFKERPGFPTKEAAGYPLGAVVRWLKDHVWVVADQHDESKSLTIRNKEADLELKELEAEDFRINLAAKRERLVDRDTQMLENVKIFAYVRGRLEKQASEHAMIFPEDIRADAVREWNEANRLLCREMSQHAPDPTEEPAE